MTAARSRRCCPIRRPAARSWPTAPMTPTPFSPSSPAGAQTRKSPRRGIENSSEAAIRRSIASAISSNASAATSNTSGASPPASTNSQEISSQPHASQQHHYGHVMSPRPRPFRRYGDLSRCLSPSSRPDCASQSEPYGQQVYNRPWQIAIDDSRKDVTHVDPY